MAETGESYRAVDIYGYLCYSLYPLEAALSGFFIGIMSLLSRSNVWKFVHKSFLEYLFANYAANRLPDNRVWNKNTAIAITINANPEDLLNMLESLEFTGVNGQQN